MKKLLGILLVAVLWSGASSVSAQLRVMTVPQGGTGASTLTGCLTGNGTGAITGSGVNCLTAASAFPFTPTSWGNSTSTTLGFLNGFLSTASSTFTGGFLADRSTTTQATTTNFFSTTASSTNLFSSFLTVGGTQGLNVIANGNVGIGTANPLSALNVRSSVGDYGILRVINSGTNAEAGIGFRDDSDSDTQSWVIGKSVAGNTDKLVFYYGGEKMTIQTDGNVGIGLTGPSQLLTLGSTGALAWDNGAGTADTMLRRQGANIIAQRNGTTAQEWQLYHTYTDASNYERVRITWSSNRAYIITGAAGSGTNRDLVFGDSESGRWYIAGTVGNFLAESDNAYDFGSNGANRAKTAHLGTSMLIATSTTDWASLNIGGTAARVPLAISTTTAVTASSTLFMVDKAGDVHYGGGTPTLSSCGTAPTLDGNSTDQAGTVTFGATASGCTITFSTAKASSPHCLVSTRAVSLVNAYTVAQSVSALTITQAASGGVSFDYFCPLGH